jgi:serine/threonine protein kinase
VIAGAADEPYIVTAFGCMAHELLTGHTPFGDRPPAKLFVAHLSEKPENVLERRPDASPTLAALVMQCLEKDPDDRPQSASDVLSALGIRILRRYLFDSLQKCSCLNVNSMVEVFNFAIHVERKGRASL